METTRLFCIHEQENFVIKDLLYTLLTRWLIRRSRDAWFYHGIEKQETEIEFVVYD
jgi:hypothetical protein